MRVSDDDVAAALPFDREPLTLEDLAGLEPHDEVATGPSNRVSCHMPRIAEALLFKARSQQIDDIPDAAMTARFGADDSPNACLTCRGDRSIEWLTSAMAARRR